MAYTPDLSRVFMDGHTVRLNTDSECQLQVKQIAELTLTTGRIVACDPVTMWTTPAFQRDVLPGRYPVLLTTALYSGGEQREAFASVQFSPEKPVRWEMAVNAYQDVSNLHGNQFFGYGVSSGAGCFMDAQAAPIMKARARTRLYESDDRKLDLTRFDAGSSVLDKDSGLNTVNFHSGSGNGLYPSFWGFDSQDNVVCLTTDFCLFPDEASVEV